jgi:hypothetical protein
MGKLKGDPATEDTVSATPTQVEWDGNLSSTLPPWAIDCCNRWFKRDRDDLKLRFEFGLAINNAYGSPKIRQPRGQHTIKTLAIVLEIDASEISRMRNFAELADNFEQFREKHQDLTTWNRVKLHLAGKPAGEERSLAQALIRRLKGAADDLRKPAFAMDAVDGEELRLELRKLARELESRAHIRLTVDSVQAEAAA